MRWVGALLVLASCYDVPKPACGFRCGPAAACPADYSCAEDGFCHAAGSSPALTCPLVDAGIDAFDFWPFIQELSPLDDAMGIAIETDVSVKFTEQVLGISATTFTLVVEGETTPVPATVTYDLPTRTATLDPDEQLRSSKRYVAALGDGIEDARGNPIYGKRTWAFKTAHDTAPPMVTMISPPAGTTGVPIDSIIVVTFSEQIQYPNGGFDITPSGFVIGYVSQTAVKLTPAGVMTPNTTYLLTMTSAITDLTGNPLANAPVLSSFTTGADAIPPTVLTRAPDAGDVDVAPAVIVTVQFSEPVAGISPTSMTLADGSGLVTAQVQYIAASNTARLTPTLPLAAGTLYTVQLAATITDANGNSLAPVSWSFTTAP